MFGSVYNIFPALTLLSCSIIFVEINILRFLYVCKGKIFRILLFDIKCEENVFAVLFKDFCCLLAVAYKIWDSFINPSQVRYLNWYLFITFLFFSFFVFFPSLLAATNIPFLGLIPYTCSVAYSPWLAFPFVSCSGTQQILRRLYYKWSLRLDKSLNSSTFAKIHSIWCCFVSLILAKIIFDYAPCHVSRI